MPSTSLIFKDRILYTIIILLGFQQFPIIRAGGSLKIYEIFGFLLMVYNIIHYQKKDILDRITIYSFLFFVVVPVLSYIYSSIFLDYPSQYYMRWPKAASDFKTSYYLFPFLLLFYMAMNYSVFNSIMVSNELYKNLNRLMKTAVVYGTIISLYSFCALYIIDFVHLLPEWIQFKHTTGGNRSTGLSQEPGTYVLYQTWICLFLWFSKKSYKKNNWIILFLINVSSLLLTQSTALWGLFICILGSIFIFKGSAYSKAKTVIWILISILTIYVVVWAFNYQKTIISFFFTKVQTFAVKNGHTTTDSGSTRKYLSDIGFKVFLDHPFFGTGYARSMYYMYQYQYKVGISVFTEPMFYGSTPLNFFSIIPAETGLIGLIIFLIFYFSIMIRFWKNRNKSPLHRMFLIGGFVELVALFSLYTPHALFLWAYLGLGLGYIKYYDRTLASENIKAEEGKTAIKNDKELMELTNIVAL